MNYFFFNFIKILLRISTKNRPCIDTCVVKAADLEEVLALESDCGWSPRVALVAGDAPQRLQREAIVCASVHTERADAVAERIVPEFEARGLRTNRRRNESHRVVFFT